MQFVVLKCVVLGRPLSFEGGRSVVLVHGAVRFGLPCSRAQHHREVDAGEHSVVGNHVVPGVGLVVVLVCEAGRVRVSQPQRPPSVSVVDGVAIFSLHELKEVILNDGSLVHSSGLSAGSFATDAVTEGKNVLVFVVLGVYLFTSTPPSVVVRPASTSQSWGLLWGLMHAALKSFSITSPESTLRNTAIFWLISLNLTSSISHPNMTSIPLLAHSSRATSLA